MLGRLSAFIGHHLAEIVCLSSLVLAVPGSADAAMSIGAPVTHSIRGVVKSVTATTLVLSRAHLRGEMTFEINPSTRIDGPLGVGRVAAVRYVVDHAHRIATAVALTRPADE